ncbi:hypothetical protein CQA53_10170 [Helicobacter didelphidarum]|uniref:Uncharacterized protein n=1 Tax=Helicobacter didelphidarum TaxID=2040648 RepID=A0A3D8I8W9_9HELI|nr:hypothetical protein CQA53_10170 [Helicobacter didelphidarum]
MNNKCNFGKFVLDCFLCFGVMVVSAIIFSYPFAFMVTIILSIFGVEDFSVKIWCFGDISAILLPSSLVIPVIMIFLYKKDIISYKIYKISLMLCYILLVFFILFIDYTLNCNFVK